MTHDLDVLICGAGPAGSTAAILLARAGARVMVVDRARFPREKLCGDMLNPGALATLARLGLADAAAAGVPFAGVTLTGAGGVQVTGTYRPGVIGRVISRRNLDAALLRLAERAGARVEEGVLVREPLHGDRGIRGAAVAGRTGPLELTASITIAADGAASRLARAVGVARHAPRPRRWAVGAYFAGARELTRFGEMHIRDGLYFGVAALPENLANVCAVTANRAALRHPGAFLTNVIRHDYALVDRFADARQVTRALCLGPLAVDWSACGAPGLLLAGDAAGFIDPMTGDGMRFAFQGAELAAREALSALEHGHADAHRRLMIARRREFAAKWRFNRMVRALVGSPAALRIAARAASVTPLWVEQAIRYAGDLRAA